MDNKKLPIIDNDLPPCTRRGGQVRPGFWRCFSNRLVHGQPGVASEATCKSCRYVNMPDRHYRPGPATNDIEDHERLAKLHEERMKSNPSRGFGDTVAKVTKAVGIKPCGGCKKRQEALNKLFPYKSTGKPRPR